MTVGSQQAFGQKSGKTTPRQTVQSAAILNEQVGVAQAQTESIRRQQDFQQQLFDLFGQDREELIGESARSLERIEGLDATRGRLSELELAAIEQGPSATPEQQGLIRQARDFALQAGESDIRRFEQDRLTTLREELAPGLGLRGRDAPILDRGSLVAQEAQRQQGQLVRNLGQGEAEALLNFPLEAGRLQADRTRGQQDLQRQAAQFQEQLRVAAFQNRLSLSAETGRQGIGLAGIGPATIGPTGMASKGTEFSFGFDQQADIGSMIAASSRTFKDVEDEVDPLEALEMVKALPIYRWRYKGDSTPHIGPMAEDFQRITGRGDSKTINLLDTAGLLLAATKGLGLAKPEPA